MTSQPKRSRKGKKIRLTPPISIGKEASWCSPRLITRSAATAANQGVDIVLMGLKNKFGDLILYCVRWKRGILFVLLHSGA
jgi:hypothetical protein